MEFNVRQRAFAAVALKRRALRSAAGEAEVEPDVAVQCFNGAPDRPDLMGQAEVPRVKQPDHPIGGQDSPDELAEGVVRTVRK